MKIGLRMKANALLEQRLRLGSRPQRCLYERHVKLCRQGLEGIKRQDRGRIRVQAVQDEANSRIKPDFKLSKPLVVDGQLDNWTPEYPGVYAIFDKEENLQYIGLSRNISTSIGKHAESALEDMAFVQVMAMPGATKEGLQGVWQEWIQTFIDVEGVIPPGNKQGEQKWKLKKKRPAKSDLKLTPGKGIDDLTVPLETLIDGLVKSKKVVAFIKGTRTQPECGFSYQVLSLLNKSGIDYETVNVLDNVYNPGVREAVKAYSEWPTIPQIYVNGEFVGGADILTEMDEKGELKKTLQS